jgi:hypothetical protein
MANQTSSKGTLNKAAKAALRKAAKAVEAKDEETAAQPRRRDPLRCTSKIFKPLSEMVDSLDADPIVLARFNAYMLSRVVEKLYWMERALNPPQQDTEEAYVIPASLISAVAADKDS